MKAAIYTRVSTGVQAEAGFSLEAQEKRGRAYAKAQEWTVSKVYKEEGFTGTKASRPAFDRLKAAVVRDGIERVIVARMSRLGRSARDVLNVIHDFQAYGCEVVFIEENLDTGKPHHRLMITILAAIAEMEVENVREQVKAGMTEAASQGRWQGGIPPFGTKVGDDGFLVEDKINAATIRRAAALILKGRSTQEVSDILNAENRPPPRGGVWVSSNVRRHLHRKALVGEMDWAGQPTVVPALIDRDKWDRIQHILDISSLPRGKARRRDTWLLSMRVACTCGGTFIAGGRRNNVRYYRCSNHTGDEKGLCLCDHDKYPMRPRWWPADQLEFEAWNDLMEMLQDTKALKEYARTFLGQTAEGVPDEETLRRIRNNVTQLEAGLAEARADLYAARDKAPLRAVVERLEERHRKASQELARMEEAALSVVGAEAQIDSWLAAAGLIKGKDEMSIEEKHRIVTELDVKFRVLKPKERYPDAEPGEWWLRVDGFTLLPKIQGDLPFP